MVVIPVKSTWSGGIRGAGKSAEEAYKLYQQFKDMENAGAFAVESEIIAENVPLMSNVIEIANQGMIPGGTYNNLEYLEDSVEWSGKVDDIFKVVLCDPQTSGGLLISVPEEKSAILLDKLLYYGIDNSEIIGKVHNKGELGLRPIIVS